MQKQSEKEQFLVGIMILQTDIITHIASSSNVKLLKSFLSLYRWASVGLEFLKLVCAPRLLATITQTQFEELKKLINRCLDHMTEARPLHVEASMCMLQNYSSHACKIVIIMTMSCD